MSAMISRLYLSVIIAAAAGLWALLLVLQGVSVSPVWLRPFSVVIGGMILLLLAFDRWLWRWRLFHPWFVAKPNLQGTWRGELVSTWVRPASAEPLPPIEAHLVIRQTFSSIRLRLVTQESHSDCLVANIPDDAGGTKCVVGTYLNSPKILNRETNPIHHGGMVLRILDGDTCILEGEYWTDRGTKGAMRFESWSPKLLYDRRQACKAKYRRKT